MLGLGVSYRAELNTEKLKNASYNCCIMNVSETAAMWLTLVVSVSTILTAFGLGVRWLVKHYFQEIKHELKTNGGTSIKDQMNRLEARQDNQESLEAETYKKVDHLEKQVDKLYDKLITYLGNKE
jgi:uncharacterized protein Yka (UPF0111/DUF47 family)